MEKFTYIAYPLHTYLVACLPCALSEYLLESVGNVAHILMWFQCLHDLSVLILTLPTPNL